MKKDKNTQLNVKYLGFTTLNKTICPICDNMVYKVELSENVCEEHLDDYFVTVCKSCKRVCISKSTGLCRVCLLLIELRKRKLYIPKKELSNEI